MKNQSTLKKNTLAMSILLGGALMLVGTQSQAAPWASGASAPVSGYENIEVGISTVNGGPHSAGNAGIGVSTHPTQSTDGKIDFIGLTAYAGSGPVYNLNFPITEAPATHTNLGVFSFAQAGSGDVWFGEWSENGSTAVNGTTYNGRQVYYIGDNADTSIPGSFFSPVQITYNVTGINNQYSATGVLSGQFEANFYGAAGTLTGDIQDTNGFKIDIGLAGISSSAAISSVINATASDTNGTLATGGVVSGHFFNNHDAVAGIVDFAGTQYDTAFGGQAQ